MAHTRDEAVAIARGFLRAAARRHGGIRRAFLFGSSVWGEVVCLSREEFEDDTYTLVRRIKRDGVELPISEEATRAA